jgi:hypothetical protein
VDFTSGSDVLDFSSLAFGKHLASGGTNTGALDPSHFVANSTGPTNSAQVFWYDTKNSTLYYESATHHRVTAIAMAHLENGGISSMDIHWV